MAAAVSPIERCRRHLHVAAVAQAVIGTCYFFMILVLEDDQLWLSAILVAGVSQFTTNIGGVLTARMLLYTNDQRLMQGTPKILTLSNALAHPRGRYASYVLVCTGATISTILAVARHSQAAVKVAAVAFMSLVLACDIVIWKGGTYLVRAIDRSIRTQSDDGPSRDTGASPSTGGKKYGGGVRMEHSVLLVARKKMKTAMIFCMLLSGQIFAVLLFAVFSKYGTAAPLILFGIPMGLSPQIWFSFSVQLHSGRTKSRVSRRLLPIHSSSMGEPKEAAGIGGKIASSTISHITSTRSQQHHVIPIEILAPA